MVGKGRIGRILPFRFGQGSWDKRTSLGKGYVQLLPTMKRTLSFELQTCTDCVRRRGVIWGAACQCKQLFIRTSGEPAAVLLCHSLRLAPCDLTRRFAHLPPFAV
jgi:hypothetical protein